MAAANEKNSTPKNGFKINNNRVQHAISAAHTNKQETYTHAERANF